MDHSVESTREPLSDHPTISLIAAMSQNRVIGIDNRLPWNLPEDLKRFRALTSNHVIVMGRKTYESIGKPLPNRENRVISRQENYSLKGARVFQTLEDALSAPIQNVAAGVGSDGKPAPVLKVDEIFVIGGGEIYKQALPLADRIYLTVIDRDYEGDAFFPDFSGLKFVEVASEKRYEPLPYRFLTLERGKNR
jgi:dihydrofolate reductase